jgi:signal transduction histidine kinase
MDQDGLDFKTWTIVRDISERKRSERLRNEKKMAEAANRAKSDFLANMSHELRTPLNHIIGFTEMVADRLLGEINETQEEYLHDALRSSRYLLSLINDILDLSKVEAGKLEIEPKDVFLGPLLENSLVMFKEKALKHQIRLVTNIGDIPETIFADERKLKQVVFNLLSNAVKFTPDGGEISLSACAKSCHNGFIVSPSGKRIDWHCPNGGENNHGRKKYIEVAVSDSGAGIKAEDLNRVFDPFEQAQAPYKMKNQGTGLGLSLSKSLVELHGGRIWAESEGIGSGSTFYFVVPFQN